MSWLVGQVETAPRLETILSLGKACRDETALMAEADTALPNPSRPGISFPHVSKGPPPQHSTLLPILQKGY